MTNVPDRDNIWTLYTGVDDYHKTRSFKRVFGYNKSEVV
jgi:hypothetical protein